MTTRRHVAIVFVAIGSIASDCDEDVKLVELPFLSPEEDRGGASCYAGERLQSGEDFLRVGDERALSLGGMEGDLRVVTTGGLGCVNEGRVARSCQLGDDMMVSLRGVSSGPSVLAVVRADGRTVASSEVLWVNPFHMAWRRSSTSQGLSTLDFDTTLQSEEEVVVSADGFETSAVVSDDRSITAVIPSQLDEFTLRVGTTEIKCEITPVERGDVVATVLSVSRRSDAGTDDESGGVAFLRIEGSSSPDIRVRGLPPSTELEVLGPLNDNDETAVRFVARGPFWMTVEAGDQYDSVLVRF